VFARGGSEPTPRVFSPTMQFVLKLLRRRNRGRGASRVRAAFKGRQDETVLDR
jgi:hypothetical protein